MTFTNKTCEEVAITIRSIELEHPEKAEDELIAKIFEFYGAKLSEKVPHGVKII